MACRNILQKTKIQLWRTTHGSSYKDLIVWQRAVELSLATYELTSAFPASEQFGLTNQLRRASVSVASNVAEGYGKNSKGQYLQFLGHARGSNFEVQTQLAISERLRYGKPESHRKAESLSQEVSKMLVALMARLEKIAE
jgi:four helix bundle protein